MASPNASYSVSIRVELEHRPGMLGQLTSAIGAAGGNILGLDIVEVSPGRMVRDVTVLASDAAHVERIRAAISDLAGIAVQRVEDRTFLLHRGGKIEVRSRTPLASRDDLSMAYTPGVARVCLAIHEEPELVHRYTAKAGMVAVVTDGTAVLGLGDIGPAAALPVMEGKAMLFKEFGGVNAFPICVEVTSADELVETVARIATPFGGINLEDIAAPRCFEVERRLQDLLDIPVFHDDQHGTAIVVLAALENALRVVGKSMAEISVVIVGAGAAGVAIAKILSGAGVADIVACDRHGAIHAGRDELPPGKDWLAANTNPRGLTGSVSEALLGADVVVGVSGPGLIGVDDVAKMAERPVVFALANPDPEIAPEEVGDRAAVMATGRSDYANQINNVLAFPGVFRGALDAGATRITEGMKLAAARAIAAAVPACDLGPSYIVPSVLDRSVPAAVAAAVAEAARAEGVVRKLEMMS
jgi:malate dehydrogenase (oxaloacetate-decarboxylating)